MRQNALQLQKSLQVTVCYLSAARYSLAMELHGDLEEALCYKLALEIHQASLNTTRGVLLSVCVSNQLYMTRDSQCHALPNLTSNNACTVVLHQSVYHLTCFISRIVMQLCAIAVTTCCAAASLADMPIFQGTDDAIAGSR